MNKKEQLIRLFLSLISGVLSSELPAETVKSHTASALHAPTQPIPWSVRSSPFADPRGFGIDYGRQESRVIIVNGTSYIRRYGGHVSFHNKETDTYPSQGLKNFNLPPKQICYLNVDVVYPLTSKQKNDFDKGPLYVLPTNWFYGNEIIDVTGEPIFNAAYQTGEVNLSTCSAKASYTCYSDKWGSWTVGLANIGKHDISGKYILKKGEVNLLPDNRRDSGSTIYMQASWPRQAVALLLIQGSINGDGFDASLVVPSVDNMKGAPPCSDFAMTH